MMRPCFHATMKPRDGRYGLGIRGGADNGGAVAISKIAVSFRNLLYCGVLNRCLMRSGGSEWLVLLTLM